jgi:hypothetical protein
LLKLSFSGKDLKRNKNSKEELPEQLKLGGKNYSGKYLRMLLQ